MASNADVAAQTGALLQLIHSRWLVQSLHADTVVESECQKFSLSAKGLLLYKDTVPSLRDVLLCEEGPLCRTLWNHLPKVVKTGSSKVTAMEHAFPEASTTKNAFDIITKDKERSELFYAAMSSYTTMEAERVLQVVNFSAYKTVADIGGCLSYLVCLIAQRYVMDLKEVVESSPLPEKFGVADRVEKVPGDSSPERVCALPMFLS
ncbi:hypothetical protein BDK51DRAFT_27737 [Blyttiomyces helicus]|uniref:O-methyltransferase C-terminal domain-containing protein n=1 Tax=Blyttiomyces helicus TaxID=388810 RepID=A0A4P9W0Y9_9FUNG|nr:hypothetical protein BDK51DRAFT_27737 [Blyttiomyces helicus]|eukprot:RKO84230.1 hypothetical protein BDK51DRAFT_27737 [Blyttiomyces helicus]